VAEGRKFVENIGVSSSLVVRYLFLVGSVGGKKERRWRPRKRRMSSHCFLQIPDDSASIIGMTSLYR
jgi:hypothetical protein